MVLKNERNQLNRYNLKTLIISSIVFLFLSLLFAQPKIPLIVVTQIIEHPSIDALRKGALKTLQDAGLKNDHDFK